MSDTGPGVQDITLSAGDIEIGAVELKNASTDDRASIQAANTARTTGTLVLAVQHVDATGAVLPAAPVLGAGSAVIGHVLVDSGSTTAVTQATGTNLHAVVDSGTLTTCSTVTNVSQLGGANVPIGAGTEAAAIRVTIPTDGTGQVKLATGANTIGALTANQSVNVAQVAGATTSTAASGVQKVGITGNTSAVVDGVVTAATSPANMIMTGGIYNSTEPSPTTGQSTAIQLDAKGRTRHVIMDAAGNTRGANVNASSQLSVSVDAVAASNISSNLAQVGGASTATAASGTLKVGVVGNAAATLDAVVGAATAPTNMLAVGGVYNSTELSPTTGQSTALQLDAKGRQRMVIMDAAGNTRGVNVNASNQMSVSIDAASATNISTNVAQMNGVTVTMGNGVSGTGVQRVAIASDNSAIAGVGAAATGAAVPANASYGGLLAQTANPSAATAGNLVGALSDKLGKQVVVGSIRDLKGTQKTTITSSTAETTIVTAVASTFCDLYGLIIANSSATTTSVTIKDSTSGTTRFIFRVPANDTRGFVINESAAHNQATVNNNWTATCADSVASIEITAMFVKNI